MTPVVRILACGSEDGGDDRAALAAVRALGTLPAGAVIEEVGQLSAEHLLDDRPEVVRLVVDCVAGGVPGEVIDVPLAELPALEARLQPGSTHALAIGQAVALAARLGALHPADRFLGIGGVDFRLGAGLSPAVAAGLRQLTGRILERVG